MAEKLDQTGVIQVDGAWATSVKYAADSLGPEAGRVQLRFMQGRAEVARAAVPREHLSALIGEQNRRAIERHIANDADKYLPVVAGELRGQRLTYQKVTLKQSEPSPEENSIAQAPTRERTDAPSTQKRPDLADAKNKDDSTAKPSPGRRARDDDAAPANSSTTAVPPHIAAKYLIRGDSYHFDDQTIAFVDKGTALTVKTHNKAILEDLIAIAQARQWQAVTVSGTEAFRREAWKAAVAAGLTVHGYRASEIERAEAKRAAEKRVASASETKPREPASDSDQQKSARGVRYGVLVAHGEAPYRHDVTQSPSYFVTVRDQSGQERTSWGVGLKEAMRDSRTAPAVNDRIGIRRAGSTAVSLSSRTRAGDTDGPTPIIEAKRYRWQVEKADYFVGSGGRVSQDLKSEHPRGEARPLSATTEGAGALRDGKALTRDQEAAAAIRNAAITREDLQLKYPDINRAVFQHLASHDQFADAYVKSGLIRESDRAQVIAQMRERLAVKLEKGEPIREPDNKEVNTLIRRSVNRVAADIGRPPVEIEPRTAEPPRAGVRRAEVQVRA